MKCLRILPLVLLAACESTPKPMRWTVCYDHSRGTTCYTSRYPTRRAAVEAAAVGQAKSSLMHYYVVCEDRLPPVNESGESLTPSPTIPPEMIRYHHDIIDTNSMPECPVPTPKPGVWVRLLGVFTATDAGAAAWPYDEHEPWAPERRGLYRLGGTLRGNHWICAIDDQGYHRGDDYVKSTCAEYRAAIWNVIADGKGTGNFAFAICWWFDSCGNGEPAGAEMQSFLAPTQTPTPSATPGYTPPRKTIGWSVMPPDPWWQRWLDWLRSWFVSDANAEGSAVR